MGTSSRNHVLLLPSADREQTLQFEGQAQPVDLQADRDLAYREMYYQVWPDGRARRAWPNISYWRITPKWVRYSDYDRGPLIVESKVT